MKRRQVRPGDDGAILVIALIIITVVALVTGVVLTRGDGSIRATVALREVAGSTYAADGAAQVAINGLRTGYWTGTDAKPSGWAFNNSEDLTGCFGRNLPANPADPGVPVDVLTLNNLYPATGKQSVATSAAVKCEAEDATGAQGSPVPITNANKPGNAILALGQNPTEIGIDVKPQSSSVQQLRIKGGIWSNSNIVASNGGLRSTESIRANTGCTPVAEMDAPVVQCNGAGVVPDPEVAEPAKYAHLPVDFAGAQQLATVPTSCPTGAGVVTFSPGYYDDAVALNNITDKNSCSDDTFYFSPGTYYFDFHNFASDLAADADIVPSAANEWVIGVGDLVAGTPTSGVGGLAGLTGADFPGTCVNPIDNIDNSGVQFIFGGDSRMVVDDGANVEICGDYKSDQPPIAVYGLKSGNLTSTSLSEAAGDAGDPLVPTGPPDFSAGAFGTVAATALQDNGNGSATWTRPNTGGTSAINGTITMHGFVPSATIPKGAVIKTATLRIRHRSGTTASSIKITPTTGSGVNVFDLPVRSAAVGLDEIPLASKTGWGAFQDAVHDNGLSGLNIEYTAKLRKLETAELDFVRLELTYYLPQLRGQTDAGLGGANNCLADLNSCAIISTPTAYKDSFYIQGTTYAPISRVSLNLNQATAQVMRFGVIVRSLYARTTGGYDYDGPVIELPDNSPGWGFSGTLVQLTVYLCVGSSSCTVDSGKEALTARVQMWDDTGVPVPPNRGVTVMSWSHKR